MAPASYDVFLLHRYAHSYKKHADCPYCFPPPTLSQPPWDLLKSVRLTPQGKRRAGGS